MTDDWTTGVGCRVSACPAVGPGLWRMLGAAVLVGMLAVGLIARAAPEPIEPVQADDGPRLTIRLAPADAPAERVDAREGATPIYAADAAPPPDRTASEGLPEPIGERVTLWVRNAVVTGPGSTNTFERYYKGKYINRSSELSVPLAELGAGEYVISPGGHRFTLAADGRATSDDPDIIIDGQTVTLKVYGVDIMAARADAQGPIEGRLEPEAFGLFVAPEDNEESRKRQVTVMSRGGAFCPLRIYLPANTERLGYILYPYGQTFHVLPGGSVELTGQRLAGIEVDGSRIAAELAVFKGRIATKTSLGAGLGSAAVHGDTFVVRPSPQPLVFTAGFGLPSDVFGLPVDPDITHRPQKYFVADNMGVNPADVRLLAIEMNNYVLTAGERATVSLRFVENHLNMRAQDIVGSPSLPASVTATNVPSVQSGWDMILTALDAHNPAAAPAGHPFSRLRDELAETPGRQGDRTRPLVLVLDRVLHDPDFYNAAGFAGFELSAASLEAVARGIAGLSPDELVLVNRGLLADLFPGAFNPFDRVLSIAKPTVRAEWSAYYANLPTRRMWSPFEVLEWRQSDGTLSMAVPDLPSGFYHVRFMVVDGADAVVTPTELYGEFPVAVMRSGQTGSASIVSPRGRDVFVAGETVRLEAVLRSADARRAAGRPTIVLRHPDGRMERVPFEDSGGAWCVQPLELVGATTRHLPAGRYELSFADLPVGIEPWPLSFELVGSDPLSLYTIVKNSKYAGAMPIASWFSGRSGAPIDIDRAVRTLAGLGYNRFEQNCHRGLQRTYTDREQIAARDPRLPPPQAVYQPSARDRLMNACVRHGIRFSDELLYYNDFHLPRYIDPYIKAAERWISREAAAMRHSPAFDGIFIYQEMYEWGKMGVVDSHTELWPRIRERVAAERFGERPADIRNRMGRELRRPRAERDPEVLKRFLELRRFEIAGWGDFNRRLALAAREVAPRARIGTYNQAFLQVTAGLGAVSSGVDMDCGFRPDVFRDLDIRSIIHYQDGPCGGWIHSPMLVQLLRFEPRRPVWINYPVRIVNSMSMPRDGQYQRRMAFAFLAEGADGISLWGLPHSFADGPNPAMLTAAETTAHLNREVLAPFGELVTATEPGYRKVGIVHTENQMILSAFKELRTANQIEEIWLACWRLGFPAVFLREDAFERPLDGLDVIFVPGIRFDGELDANMVQRLRDAIARGAHVVVERNSTLDLDGIERVDFDFNNYFLGPGYNPGLWEDEIYRIWRYTQPTVDFLADRMPKWTQSAAAGPFTVGPNWRRGGDIEYLIMGNYEFPDYSAALKQVMARPVLLPLTVGAERGDAAYDLLRGVPIPLEKTAAGNRLTLDMTRMQGAIVAFLPEPVRGMRTEVAFAAESGVIRVGGTLTGVSGKPIDGVFPARITLTADGQEPSLFYRAIGAGRTAELRLPGGAGAMTWRIEVREAFTGLTVVQSVERPAVTGSVLRALTAGCAYVPYPDEVKRFWKENREVLLVVGGRTPGMKAVADSLEKALTERGIKVTRKMEHDAYRYGGGAGMDGDGLADGFHTWGGYGEGQKPIKPAINVAAPLVLLTAAGGSSLLDALEDCWYFSLPTIGGPGLVAQPTVQKARRAFHPDFDTLCLIANDPESMRHAVAAALGEAAESPPEPFAAAGYGPVRQADSAQPVAVPPPSELVGNNEMITDLRFDTADNIYLTTWCHGDNLYSLDREGVFRFSSYLPELGPTSLRVCSDRVLAFTSVGARLYQLGLDGTAISQMRLPRDPGVGEERLPYYAVFDYAEPTRLVVYYDDMNDAIRVIDGDGALVGQWQGDPYEDPEDPAGGRRRRFHRFAVSPDGKRLAQIVSTQYKSKLGDAYDSYLVVRELTTGRKLAEWPEILANEPNGVSVGVQWRPGDDGPAVTVHGELIRFDAGLTKEVGRDRIQALESVFDLGERGVLQRAESCALRWVGRDGRSRALLGPFEIMPTVVELSPDAKTFFFLDEYGQAGLYDTGTGNLRCAFKVPELGAVARFTADSARLLIGGLRGTVLAYDLSGTLLWQRNLGQHNRTLLELKPLDRVVGFPVTPPPATGGFVDHTEKQWPSLVDEPGQLEKLVDLDRSRLINGDATGDGGWLTDGAVAYSEPGFEDARSIRVGTSMVTQVVSGFIGDHFTWVLEFRYRRVPGGAAARLTAGMRSQGREPTGDPLVVVRHFDADDAWRFARIVTKSGAAAESLAVGFRSAGGETLVDAVSLRRCRFPSVNHMLYPPIHSITPRILTNPRFMETYDPVGRLREAMPNRIIVQNLSTISQNLLDSAFLQNARLNDVGSDWYIYPLGGNKTDIGLGLREPRWISMVGVYFNAYDESNITPHYDILATDLNTNQKRLVASVRNNRQLFQLTKFKPMLADEVTVRLLNTLTRQRTVTEVEIYGPLSGEAGKAGFVDPDGQNTYMGDFTRVDRRRMVLGRDVVESRGQPIGGVSGQEFPLWNNPITQVLVDGDRAHIARALGYVQSKALRPKVRDGFARVNGFGFGNPGALYGGVWLLPGNDGILYGIDLASSRKLWSVPLGVRLRGGPVAIGNDVFAASDTGRLCALDLGSGALLREAKLSGGVVGSLATDGAGLVFISEDGRLQCWDAGSFEQRWAAQVATWTESTPAIDDGVVYTADRAGVVRAVRMTDGGVLWSVDLKEEFTRCPVVADTSLYLGCRRGKLVALNRADGVQRWETRINTAFPYEPLPVTLASGEAAVEAQSALLVLHAASSGPPSGGGQFTVVNRGDGSLRPWELRINGGGQDAKTTMVGLDVLSSISYCHGTLYLVGRASDGGHDGLIPLGQIHQGANDALKLVTIGTTEQ